MLTLLFAVLSGLLTDPINTYPGVFGPNSTLGGPTGVAWMKAHPYALANLLPTMLLFAEAAVCHFCLDETLKGFRTVEMSAFDPIRLAKSAYTTIKSVKSSGYKSTSNDMGMARRGLLSDDSREGSLELERLTHDSKYAEPERQPNRLAFSRIWTSNVCWTLLSIAVFDFHMGAFSTLWILFLSAAREYVPNSNPGDPTSPAVTNPRSAFKFSGGLAFPPQTIGFAMATIGFIGIILQFLLYPYANARFGLMR